MRWFKKYSNDSPRLISLSPLRSGDQDDGSILAYYSTRCNNQTDNEINNSNQQSTQSSSQPQTPIIGKQSSATTTPTATGSSLNATTIITMSTRKSRIGN